MIEFYVKGRNKILDAIDHAHISISKNERKRLQKALMPLMWEVSKGGFKQGYNACEIQNGIKNDINQTE